jgi:hypothetical protein
METYSEWIILLGLRWKRMLSFMLRPLCPVTCRRRLGGPQSLDAMVKTEFSSPEGIDPRSSSQWQATLLTEPHQCSYHLFLPLWRVQSSCSHSNGCFCVVLDILKASVCHKRDEHVFLCCRIFPAPFLIQKNFSEKFATYTFIEMLSICRYLSYQKLCL